MPPRLSQQVVQAITEVIGDSPRTLHEPRFHGNEWSYLKECLDSTYVSSVGAFVNRFENELAAYTGASHAVAVVNGTAALHMALLLAGVQTDDEVLVPAVTFVATANAVRYCGAWPHFVDSEPLTLGMDATALREYLQRIVVRRGCHSVNRETGRILRVLVPMHVFGHPVNLDELLAVAEEYHLVVIEDAAESLGSTWRGRHTGTLGLFGILSFNGNKIITTGGGGCILTQDEALARKARHLTTTAKLPHRWAFDHDSVAYNYRMPNLNAALGVAQMEKIDEILASKRKVANAYTEFFKQGEKFELYLNNTKNKQQTTYNKQIIHITEPTNTTSNYWLNAIILPNRTERDEFLKFTNDKGVMTRPIWKLMNKLEMFSDCQCGDLSNSEWLEDRVVNVPSSVRLY